jgi:dimethylargininase
VFVAITRAVSPALASCELTHLQRTTIDVERARQQHRAYEQALIAAGGMVQRLESGADMPDAVFIEDTAIVVDELALIARPGAVSRRGEAAAVVDALAPYRPLVQIEPPGTVDGGDVLVVGREVFVGLSTRTNNAAVAQMRAALEPHGYAVHPVTVRGCLHLKSAVTALDDATVLVNRQWIDSDRLRRFTCIEVDPSEASAANALRLPDRIIFPAAFPRTAERLVERGFRLEIVDASELAKAEGAVTCCSLIIRAATTQR